MSLWAPANLILKQAIGAFHQGMQSAPNVWKNHCQVVNSTTAEETYAFPGFIPEPRRFLSERNLVGIRDFTFNLENYEYELSFKIARKYWEDDQTGLILERTREVGQVLATFDDSLFGTLLQNGNVAGNTAFDGTVFHSDTRTIGDSANVDNNLTAVAAAADAVPTASELLTALQETIATMSAYQDDTGRPGFNAVAQNQIRLVVPTILTRACTEAFNSTFIGSSDNPWGRGLAGFDPTPYVPNGTTTQEIWVNFTGAERMPFIRQERMPWEIVAYADTEDVAKDNGVVFLCRARFRFGYGEPRRSVLYTFTT